MWRLSFLGLVCALTAGLEAGQVSVIQTATHNDSIYYLLSPSTWSDAEAYAVSVGGHLATMFDAAENQWVWDTFNPGSDRYLWIGLNDVETDTQFAWSSGQPVGFTDFRVNEPSSPRNDGLGGPGPENFVQMGWRTQGPSGWFVYPQWNDLPDTDFYEFPLHGVVEVLTPEPSAAALALLAAGCLLPAVRRRARRAKVDFSVRNNG